MTELADAVRRYDPDRFFCALFAPADRRAALMTLYAFNHALARAQEVASEPTLALIRLQWWREVVEGAAKRHEVASPLTGLLESGLLPRALALSIIEAREEAVEAPPETEAGFVGWLRRGPGALAAAAGAVLGGGTEEQDGLCGLGAAYGAAGMLRNLGAAARRQRFLLPAEILDGAGLTAEALAADPARGVAAVAPFVNRVGLGLLGRRRPWRRALVAAALPGVLARRDLRRRVPVAERGAGDRMAVLRAVAFPLI